MYFDETNNQHISEVSDLKKFGDNFKVSITLLGITIIPAGTLMTFCCQGKPYLMFQTLQDLNVATTNSATLMYYERGSIVFITDGEFIPTLRFRDCRFPTKIGYNLYERRPTI